MTTNVRVEGLEELRAKLEAYPGVFQRSLMTTMQAVLYKVWEMIPGYPTPPQNSTYRRTGTLGRSIGVSEGGHKLGKPDIFEVRRRGADLAEASIGTRLEYAPEVIGEAQKPVHQGRWWTLKGVSVAAEPHVVRLFETMAAEIAAWLNDERGQPA